MADTGVAIHVENLSKCFNLYPHPKDIVLEFLLRRTRHTEFWALKDLNFSIKRGEVIGVVGKNGSGKSTLARILTGVLDYTRGKVQINGRVSAILELGTGFHPYYSGRENIMRGGMVLGMSRREVEAKMDSIIDFSGLREFIDRPFRSYSSGMQSRLTFATATAIDPDIFIVDEALATGDAAFVHKSLNRIRAICAGGCTAILVSHTTSILGAICDRVLWMERGQIRRLGDPVDVIREYDLLTHLELSDGQGQVHNVQLAPNQPIVELQPGENVPIDTLTGDAKNTVVFRRGPIRIKRVDFLDETGTPTGVFRKFGAMTIRVSYYCDGPVPDETLGMAMCINRAADLTPVTQFNTHCFLNAQDISHYRDAPFRTKPGREGVFEARIDPMLINTGEYLLSVGLLPNIEGQWCFYEYHHHVYPFKVTNAGIADGGFFTPVVAWDHQPAQAQAQAA